MRDDPTNGPAIDVTGYLEWIGFGGTVRHDRATLAELQQLHMTAVPFENLDIVDGHGHRCFGWLSRFDA